MYVNIDLSPIFKLLTRMLTRLLAIQNLTFAHLKNNRPKSVRQRIKYYSRYPDRFRLKTKMRPPNLEDPALKFPIHVPIKYRHEFHLKKELFIDNSSKIHWNRLEPNQILLGLEKVEFLSFEELTEGLYYLSDVKGQELHNWNEHEWVNNGMNKIRDNLFRMKKKDTMSYYTLMKKLRYSNQQFWKKMYAKLQQNIYELYPSQFEYIFINYYDKMDAVFSPQAKQNFTKLMENRIRQFSPDSILKVFQIFLNEKKLTTYWLENVFISLFKEIQYVYTPAQIAQIFRFMMIVGHEQNQRLYTNLYSRIAKFEFNNNEEISTLEEVLLEVKEIFTSHRVDQTLQLLQKKREELSERQVKVEKTLAQMVKDDLKYFLEKKKLKQENAAAL